MAPVAIGLLDSAAIERVQAGEFEAMWLASLEDRVEPEPLITLRPKYGMRMRLESRETIGSE